MCIWFITVFVALPVVNQTMFWFKIETKSYMMHFFFLFFDIELSQVASKKGVILGASREWIYWTQQKNGAHLEMSSERLDVCGGLSGAKELQKPLSDASSCCSYWPIHIWSRFWSAVSVVRLQLRSGQLYNQKGRTSMGHKSVQLLHKAVQFSSDASQYIPGTLSVQNLWAFKALSLPLRSIN